MLIAANVGKRWKPESFFEGRGMAGAGIALSEKQKSKWESKQVFEELLSTDGKGIPLYFPIPVESIQGVAGQRTILPCNIQPRESNDAVSMVLWFKEDSGEPLYSERRRCRYHNPTTLVPRPLADSNARYHCGLTAASLRAPVRDIDFAITEMGIDTAKV
ncbi:Uncharacterized protein DBV15_09096 [Temnothorax longispinosus]|uniref:Ig-like domain-containing protein n=1 Tax=Temnothorax longispinosus TaxID=300112 RepID=A0A4S2KPJ9_9HYME|nr:Uncharacterized protein DBV15_09096 [Temnothorax longispinosus]